MFGDKMEENENQYKENLKTYIKVFRNLGLNLVPFFFKTKEPIPQYKNGISDEELNSLIEKENINIGFRVSKDIVVLDFEDIDLISAFLPDWASLQKETIFVKTPKGIHVYLKVKEPIKTKAFSVLSLNLIGEGDYVILPPSIHPNGEPYIFYGGGILEIKLFEGDLEEYINKQLIKFKLRIKKKAEQVSEEEYKRIEQGKIKEKETWWARTIIYLKLRSQRRSKTDIENEIYEFNNKCEKPESFEIVSDHLEWLFEHFPPISILDVFDNQGRPNPGEVAQLYLNEKLGMVATTKDKEQTIYFFNGRVWEEAATDIAAFVKNILGNKATTHFVNEVLNHVRWSTFDNQKILSSEPPPHLIPLANGVFDINKEKLIDYEPEFNFLESQIIPVKYDPNAKCPNIEKFLSEVLFEQDIPVIKEYSGYCLYRRYILNKSLLLIGVGSNGKSVFLKLLKEFLGQKNVSARTIQELIYNRFAAASLYRKLANIFADIPSDALKTTSMFKALTGEDFISAEKKYGKEPVEFTNYAKLIFSANQFPEAYDDTDAFYRRFIIIEFPNQFEGEKADPFLINKITTEQELSGFLNLALAGLKSLLARGRFSDGMSINKIREEYQKKASPVAFFTNEMIEEDSDSVIPVGDVYDAFVEFCRVQKLVPCSDKVFGKKFRLALKFPLQITRKEIDGRKKRCFVGIRIKETTKTGGEQDVLENFF